MVDDRRALRGEGVDVIHRTYYAATDPRLREQISALDRIVGLRNRLAHGYATISDEVIWGIVEGSVPTLRREIAALG